MLPDAVLRWRQTPAGRQRKQDHPSVFGKCALGILLVRLTKPLHALVMLFGMQLWHTIGLRESLMFGDYECTSETPLALSAVLLAH